MRKLRVGIIGLGVGEQHILGYLGHPSCEIGALCDLNEKKLNEVGQIYPDAQRTTNASDILQSPDIDVVSIASYDNHHFEQIAAGLQAGKHLFVEKPICLHRSELQRLRELSRERPEIQISSNLILRMSPRFRALRESLGRGELGEIYYVEGDYDYGRLWKLTEGWRGQIDFYSVVHGGAIHVIDLLCWLTGDRVAEVGAFGNDISTRGSQFKYRDLVAAILKFESGRVGKVTANFGSVRPHFHRVSIYGTEGTFVNGPENAEWFTSPDPMVPPQTVATEYPGTQKGDLIGGFIESVLSGTPGEVVANDVFDIMSVCLAIEEAADTNRIVTVEYL